MSSITVPTLKQLCASQILSSGSHLTLGGENQKFFEYEVLYRLWSDLKACPQGVLCLQNEMSKIERKYQNEKGQFPADVKISVFFKELTQQFSSKFAEAGVQLGNLTPVYCHEYSQIQEVLRKTWEDEALKLIWDEGIIPRLIGPAPQLDLPDDIRKWLKEEANAHQLMGVTALNFHQRKIKALPPEIRYCTQLQAFDFGGNQISYLPEDIFEGCTKLRLVRLNDNQISNLPETLFKSCTELRDVFLHGNEISSVPGALFKGCAQLNMLIFSNNKISCLPETLLADCAQLKRFQIDYNEVTSLPEVLFANCSQLGAIQLRNNRITSLPGSLFANCTELGVLLLDGNRIRSFPETIFANCTSLGSVWITDNPLFCFLDGFSRGHIFLPTCGHGIISKKDLCYRNAVFNNYNCLSKFSGFVKLLSFGTDNSAKIKDVFAQLERRDQCLIVDMFLLVSGTTPEDLKGNELRVFEDMNLLCHAVQKGIYEKVRRMSNEEIKKVDIEIYNLGKQEMMQSEEFMKWHSRYFSELSKPGIDPRWASIQISGLGSSYAPENILLLLDAMDRVGV